MKRIKELVLVTGILGMLMLVVLAPVITAQCEVPVVRALTPDDIMKSVVHIQTDAGKQGSGCYVGHGLIMTAGHVINGAYGFTVTFENGVVYESDITYAEPEADVGFIYIGVEVCPALIFDNDGFTRGNTVFVYGNPHGWIHRFSVTKGIVSNAARDCEGFFGNKLMLQVDAASWPGNSGGPVTDAEGEIVGILVGGYWESDNMSLCIPVGVCRQAMNTYLQILAMESLN